VTQDATSSLRRAAELIRLAGPTGPAPDVSPGADALVCPATGRTVPVRDGIVDLLETGFEPSTGQRVLDTAPSAWLYDRLRPHLGRWMGMPSFDAEVRNVIDRLVLEPGSTVLDIACGQGNFTLELARYVGPDGLVIGIDIAMAMLKRAALHLRESGLANVVLLRGDALDLPFGDGSLAHINCSGGLHQFPDWKQAIAEMARTNQPGGRMAISGFASPKREANDGFRRWFLQGREMDSVPMDELEAAMQSVGYREIGSEIGRRVGYCWGARQLLSA